MNTVKHDNIIIAKMGKDANIPYHLLLLADPEKTAIDKYIFNADTYIATYDTEIIGVYVLLPVDDTTMELKNIAVAEKLHRQGIGKYLVDFASRQLKENGYRRFIVGTGNSSMDELYFYQRMGFEIYDIKKNFFTENYTHPIIENGIQAKHMLMLENFL